MYKVHDIVHVMYAFVSPHPKSSRNGSIGIDPFGTSHNENDLAGNI